MASGFGKRTPEVYAIELVEFPKEIPIAKVSAGAVSFDSSALIVLVRRFQVSCR